MIGQREHRGPARGRASTSSVRERLGRQPRRRSREKAESLPPCMPKTENFSFTPSICFLCDSVGAFSWIFVGADSLDPEFVRRLHAVLSLTDRNEIAVVLDNHGDMVGSAGCGNGIPMWLQKRAAPELIGAPLVTPFPYNLDPGLVVEKLEGYSYCGDNATRWAQHAGDPNYNLLNECCQQMNGGNPIQLGASAVSQKTMDYILTPGAGRDAFVRYWRLMAEAVREHRSAIAAELMNEPITLRRTAAFDTWRACAEAINEVVPDMAVRCDGGHAHSASRARLMRAGTFPQPGRPCGGGGDPILARRSSGCWRADRRRHGSLDQGELHRLLRLALLRQLPQDGGGRRPQRAGALRQLGRAELRHRVRLMRGVEGGGRREHLAHLLALFGVLHHWPLLWEPLGPHRHLRGLHPGLGGWRRVVELSAVMPVGRGSGRWLKRR